MYLAAMGLGAEAYHSGCGASTIAIQLYPANTLAEETCQTLGQDRAGRFRFPKTDPGHFVAGVNHGIYTGVFASCFVWGEYR